MEPIFKYEHPFVCTDAVVFTIRTQKPDSYRKLPEASLQVLLYKRAEKPYENTWCLPGGFLNIDELPEDNISRKISEKSHVDSCVLEQLYTFCDLKRDPRARVISIAYLGLMNEMKSQEFNDKGEWFSVQLKEDHTLLLQNGDLQIEEGDLGFDHYFMIKTALMRLQSKIWYSNMAFHLLPTEFTLTQLQNVYEVILGKKEQAANFRRKIIHLVEETNEYTSDKGHRPAKIYIKKIETEDLR